MKKSLLLVSLLALGLVACGNKDASAPAVEVNTTVEAPVAAPAVEASAPAVEASAPAVEVNTTVEAAPAAASASASM